MDLLKCCQTCEPSEGHVVGLVRLVRTILGMEYCHIVFSYFWYT